MTQPLVLLLGDSGYCYYSYNRGLAVVEGAGEEEDEGKEGAEDDRNDGGLGAEGATGDDGRR